MFCTRCKRGGFDRALRALEGSIDKCQRTIEELETRVTECDRVISGLQAQCAMGASRTVLELRLKDTVRARKESLARLKQYRGKCRNLHNEVQNIEDTVQNAGMIKTMQHVLQANMYNADVMTQSEVYELVDTLEEARWDTQEISAVLSEAPMDVVQPVDSDDDEEIAHMPQVPIAHMPFSPQMVLPTVVVSRSSIQA
jgi:chromosome segregation ATPase